MAKHATKFSHRQLVDCPRSVAVQWGASRRSREPWQVWRSAASPCSHSQRDCQVKS